MTVSDSSTIKESQSLFSEEVSDIFNKSELKLSEFQNGETYQVKFDRALSYIESMVVANNKFEREAEANLYYKNIKDFLVIILDARNVAIEKFHLSKRNIELLDVNKKNFPPLSFFNDLPGFFTLLGIIGLAIIQWEKLSGWDLFGSCSVGAIGGFILGNAIQLVIEIVLMVPYKAWASKKKKEIQDKTYDLPTWLKFIDKKASGISGLIDSTLNEVIAEIRRKKYIQHTDDLLNVEDKYNEKISNRNLSERLAMISAELQAAKERAKDLQDEHRLTEELRVKYAREMKDIERQSINDGNNDLLQKVQVLSDLLGSK